MKSFPNPELTEVLKHSFGFDDFKPNQQHIVESWLSGKDVFAALPTGGGKSLCYQLPALIRDGLTVVVSPLIALMKDQVDAARENGIAAAYLNSSQDAETARAVWRDLAAHRAKLLYVSPERLSSPEFRSAIADFGVSAFAVDEAHCVSEWGHEFRPDYRTLASLRQDFPEAPIAAFTATATRLVQDDIVAQLRLIDPVIVRAGFNRPEITYRVRRKSGVDAQILRFVTEHEAEPGIIYRSTRKATEQTAQVLQERGVSAKAYHAGLDDQVRSDVQEAFVRDDVQVVVATIAFGMGIDKSNVRWILHGDLPKSLEGYYQETGRAGRDGEPADALLLWGPQDIAIIRRHIGNMQVDEERDSAEERLREVLRYVEGRVCRRTALLAHFDEEFPGSCSACDVCLDELTFEDATVPAQKLLSAAVRTGEVFGTHHLVDIVTGTATDKVLERGHEQLPTFGVGEDRNRSYWIALARDLESAGFLTRRQTDSGVPGGLRLSTRGRLLLRGRETFASVQQDASNSATDTGGAASTRAGGRQGARNVPDTAPLRSDQKELLRCLKGLRKAIARQRGVPPYMVFSDKTLKVMVKNRPTDPQALLRCHGVGDRKLEAYGEAFLRTIRNYLATGECE
ncbi:MAG: DNA helicase RecQ [Spirochaetaceae bacterium]|nr:MAG: DNA helicase RecQ [Spirochaetaceae bacterium]